jgi:predicted AAA+ superfamily ATPase
MYPRHLQPQLDAALSDTPVVLVNGARQTGKSTLVAAAAAARGMRYLTLDDRVMLAAARGDPAGFVAGLGGPVVIDEVQRAPGIFLELKAAVDRDRQPGRFLLTGSANVMLLPAVADSLAGRMEVLSLLPLSSAELAGHPGFNRADWLFDGKLGDLPMPPCDRAALSGRLLAGGFPEALARASPARRGGWFENYLQAILQRDVRELASIEQLTELPELLQLLAERSAGLLNFAEMSRGLGLPQSTLKRYFALLEMLFLVERLPAWDRNPGKRLVKAPKVFVRDTGLLAHLRELSASSLDAMPGLPGALVETFVLDELRKHLAFSFRGLGLSHYRTQGGNEVDFILEPRSGARLVGIEVKASATVDGRDFKGLRHLKESEPAFSRGIVLYCGRELVPFAADLFAVPLSMWWAAPPGQPSPLSTP